MLCLMFCAVTTNADVTLRGPNFTAVLSDNGIWQSLQDADGRELCASGAKMPVAQVNVAGTSTACDSASFNDNRLTLGFGKTDTKLVYEITSASDWLVFKLIEITGKRPTHMMMLQVPVNITTHVGRRLNAACDDKTAVCLSAANFQPDCSAGKGKYAVLRAANQDSPGPKLEGAAVALMVCPTPKFKSVLRKASHEFNLLINEDANGVPVKDTELPRGSYWFLNATEADADKVVDYCKRTGFKQVMLGSGSWCQKVGHYLFNEKNFPRKEESLKAFVDKLHANDINVGMHCFASKISKTDPYVTPVPDRRFWVDKRSALTGDITAEQTEIKGADLTQWPGSPVCKQKIWEGSIEKHREVIIDDEIVQYQSIGPEDKWDTFMGCKRGAWGTKAAAHKNETELRHWGVDGCINGYIVDQETGLLDEATTRLAEVFNYCGFDMVYFDGGEDVDKTRFNYYVANFQKVTMRKFKKRPIIHMGTIMTHLNWHSFARSSTVDTYLNTLHGAISSGCPVDKWPTVRDHINKSVDYMMSVAEDMMPGELGWFGIWPKQKNTDGLQIDEIEYLMCKSLGYNVPISLETGFSQMEQHPLTPGLLDIVKVYEEMRMKGGVDEATLAKLREKNKDFVFVQRDDGKGEFVAVETLAQVAGGNDLRAEVGSYGQGSVATLWHYIREAQVVIPLPSSKVKVVDLWGKPVKTQSEDGKITLTVGGQRLALIADVPVEQLKQAMQNAQAVHQQAKRIWIQAETGKLAGEMALGSQNGLTEPESFGDFMVCTANPNLDKAHEWYGEYIVQIPHQGVWVLWARVMYPGDGDMSFGLCFPKEASSTDIKILGNCGQNGGKWHWTGSGGGSTVPPPGAPIRLTLPQGPFTFRVLAREGRGTVKLNPRIDLLCLTDDASEVLTDKLATQELAKQK